MVKKALGKVIGAHFTKKEQQAMNIEISKQLAEHTRKHAIELESMFLWFLHQEFGFGPKYLRRVHDKFMPRIDALCNRYEMTETGDDAWLCTKMLKDYGCDIEEWEKERGDI